MQYTIYAPGEIRKKIFMNKDGVLVLARCGRRLVLLRDEASGLWTTARGERRKKEKPDDAARRVLCEALGCEEVELRPLCDYVCKEKKRRAFGGRAYLASVYEWEPAEPAALFEKAPSAEEWLEPGLLLGAYQWAGDFFDDTLQIDGLCWPLPMHGAGGMR